jgi:serine/threonine-protein kinase
MMLWITVFYNYEYGPKWFPYYLDLKTQQGQEITRLLGETGGYQVLSFAREVPHRVCETRFLNIAPAQSKLLQQWAITSQTMASNAEPQFSKSLLKKEYELLKPQILNRLEGMNTDYSLTFSG